VIGIGVKVLGVDAVLAAIAAPIKNLKPPQKILQ